MSQKMRKRACIKPRDALLGHWIILTNIDDLCLTASCLDVSAGTVKEVCDLENVSSLKQGACITFSVFLLLGAMFLLRCVGRSSCSGENTSLASLSASFLLYHISRIRWVMRGLKPEELLFEDGGDLAFTASKDHIILSHLKKKKNCDFYPVIEYWTFLFRRIQSTTFLVIYPVETVTYSFENSV